MANFRKWLILRLQHWECLVVDSVGMGAILGLFIHFLPAEIFTSLPASGGDTGSHFWPLKTLVEHGLPEWRVRVWNPGNLAGEPQLLHYFPFPYLLMAVFSCVVPLGAAFNIGTLLPMLCLPFAVYCCCRLCGWRFPAPLLAAAASQFALYNESFSMWGGNTLSTLAGQFAHLYALIFLLLSVGFLARELRTQRLPLGSAFCSAAVCLSHAYIMLGLPLVYAASFLCAVGTPLGKRFLILFESGVMALILSAWFLVPMIDNSAWTVAFSFRWLSKDIVAEIFPPIFYPLAALLVGVIVSLLIVDRTRYWRRRFLTELARWLIPTLGYVGFYFIFPALGLVDIRAVPQVQLFLSLLAGLLFGHLLQRFRFLGPLLTAVAVAGSIYWVTLFVSKFEHWLRWNYSGWTAKEAYPALSQLYDKIRGDFSMPRVIYEHSMFNNAAGSERVFEMLPYFSGRATLESVYMQANILAPAAFLLQSEVSLRPSCPYSQFECKPYNLEKAKDRLQLLGVGELILRTPEVLAQTESAPFLIEDGRFDPWVLYRLAPQPTLAEVFHIRPLLSTDPALEQRYDRRAQKAERDAGAPVRVPVDPANWKELAYAWLRGYRVGNPMILDAAIATRALRPGQFEDMKLWDAPAECAPSVEVNFNFIRLHTNCPGYAHYLKFAYHPSWRTDSGDKLFLASPGFIGIIPTRNDVLLEFGVSWYWRAAGALSIVGLIGWILLIFRAITRKKPNCSITWCRKAS